MGYNLHKETRKMSFAPTQLYPGSPLSIKKYTVNVMDNLALIFQMFSEIPGLDDPIASVVFSAVSIALRVPE